MDDNPANPTTDRKPWPMRWVAAVILVYIVGYTIINVAFRKPEPPHEPYAEAQERREMRTIRASMMGWTRLVVDPAQTQSVDGDLVTARRDGDPPAIENIVPQDVMMIAPGKPHLYPAADEVRAPAVASVGHPLHLSVRFLAPAGLPPIGEPLAYAREGELHVFFQQESGVRTHWESLPAARVVDLNLPAEPFTPGPWKATLYTSGAVFSWDFTVE